MNRTQLSAYIGNIDDKLVQQAEQIPNYAMQRRHKRRKQFLASAAVLALMFSSMTSVEIAPSSFPASV